MYTAKNKTGHINVSLTWLSRSDSSQSGVNYFGLFVIPDLEKVRIEPRSSLNYHVHVYNHTELKRSYKKSKFDPEVNFQGQVTGDHESFTKLSVLGEFLDLENCIRH